MSNISSILKAAPIYVQGLLFEKLPPGRLFHNFDHAKEVAEVCAELIKDASLPNNMKEILLLAAWFHDTGYINHPNDVATGSNLIAREFLVKQNYGEERIEKVEKLISSLHSKEPPRSEMERILHDANNAYIGRKRFRRRVKLLRLEKDVMENEQYTSYTWNKKLLKILIDKKFYTASAQTRFSKRRNKNITAQHNNIDKAYRKTTRNKTGKEFGRGVDTLYRVTLRNHINLSRIADGKANIIISINTLVLSILITASAAGFSMDSLALESNLRFVIPVFLLMITSLSTIFLAVLSTIPKVSGTDFSLEEIKNHKVSMLFFGNFLQMEQPSFVQHLRDLKKDQELLYDDLSRDLYNLGMVLKKKYHLLAIAYKVFIGGLLLSFLVFLGLYLI